MGAPAVVSGILAKVEKLLDVHMPGFEISADRALAFAALVLVRSRHSRALAIVWVFNVFGLLEFFHSVVRGSLAGTGGGLGAFWYIPVCYVPLGLVVHCLIFLLLVKRSSEYTPRTAASAEMIR